jgi:hypothetical protein
LFLIANRLGNTTVRNYLSTIAPEMVNGLMPDLLLD